MTTERADAGGWQRWLGPAPKRTAGGAPGLHRRHPVGLKGRGHPSFEGSAQRGRSTHVGFPTSARGSAVHPSIEGGVEIRSD